MGAKGFYILELICDDEKCPHEHGGAFEHIDPTLSDALRGPGSRAVITAADARGALKEARSRGWQISANTTRCGDCSLRAQRR